MEDPVPLFPGEEVRGRKWDGLTTFDSVRYVKISTIKEKVKSNPSPYTVSLTKRGSVQDPCDNTCHQWRCRQGGKVKTMPGPSFDFHGLFLYISITIITFYIIMEAGATRVVSTEGVAVPTPLLTGMAFLAGLETKAL